MGGAEVLPDYKQAGEGFPLFMLPGLEGAWQFWEPQLQGLSSDYRVVACELARFPLNPRLRVEDYAEAALRRMESLGMERAVLVGESFGGLVCQHIAIHYPRKVAALVLCNTMPRPQRGGFGMNMFTLATLVHNLAFLPGLGERRRRRLLNWVGRHRGFVMDPSPGNDRLCSYLMRYGTSHGPVGYLNRLMAAARADYSGELGRIQVPTLVLRGSEDRLVTADTALFFLWKIPDARLALVEGGGHCCTHTMPERSNRLLLQWLDGLGLR
jgi:pimeloyl-ACP methyl ester carboxylesterase